MEEIIKKTALTFRDFTTSIVMFRPEIFIVSQILFGENDPGIRRCEVIKGSSITN